MGPNLSDIGSRQSEGYIRQSILDPLGYIVPGYSSVMPSPQQLGLNDQDIAALVAYLLSLKGENSY